MSQETKKEEWESRVRAEWDLWDNGRFGHLEGTIQVVEEIITSHDAELRRKIEGLAEDHYWDSLESQKDIVLLHLRAVLDLLDKKNV